MPILRTLVAALLTAVAASAVADPSVDGQLDPDFGIGGIVDLGDIPGASFQLIQVLGAVRDSRAGIIVLGSGAIGGTSVLAGIRLDSAGQVDSTYGDHGVAAVASPVSSFYSATPSMDGRLLSDGRVVIASWILRPDSARGLFIHAIDADGNVIGTYGPSNGPGYTDFKTSGDIPSRPYGAIAVGPADVVYVGGPSDVAPGSAISRLDANGSIDRSFGTDGVLPVAGARRNLAIQSDGKLLVPSSVVLPGGAVSSAVLRMLPDGQPDDAFGSQGLATAHFSAGDDVSLGIAVDGGRIYLSGLGLGADDCTVCIARFAADGTLDTAFNASATAPGEPGIVRARIGAHDFLPRLVVGVSGGIAAIGQVEDKASSNLDFGVHAVRADGRTNTAFAGGFFRLDLGPSTSSGEYPRLCERDRRRTPPDPGRCLHDPAAGRLRAAARYAHQRQLRGLTRGPRRGVCAEKDGAPRVRDPDSISLMARCPARPGDY